MIMVIISMLVLPSYLIKELRDCGMISIHKTLFNSLDKILNKADRLKYVNILSHMKVLISLVNRKLSFKDTISFILSMAGKPIREELLDFSITQIIPNCLCTCPGTF